MGAGVGSVLTYVPGQLYLAGPYNGAPSQRGLDHPRGGRTLRRRHRCRQGGADARSGHRRSARRRRSLRADPPHPRGDPAEAERPQGLRRSRPLHDQPDLLRSLQRQSDPVRFRPRRLRPSRRRPGLPGVPLPGGQLRQPRLQAEALPASEGRHQTGRAPRPQSGLQAKARRREPGQGGREAAALGLPRPGPHQDDLHQGPVGRRTTAPKERSTAR